MREEIQRCWIVPHGVARPSRPGTGAGRPGYPLVRAVSRANVRSTGPIAKRTQSVVGGVELTLRESPWGRLPVTGARPRHVAPDRVTPGVSPGAAGRDALPYPGGGGYTSRGGAGARRLSGPPELARRACDGADKRLAGGGGPQLPVTGTWPPHVATCDRLKKVFLTKQSPQLWQREAVWAT